MPRFTTDVDVYNRNSANGQNITRIESTDATVGGSTPFGIAVTEHSLFTSADRSIGSYERGTLTPGQDFTLSTSSSDNDNITGLSVVGEVYYTVDSADNRMYLHKRDPDNLTRTIVLKTIQLPSGLTTAVGLDIPSARG